MVDYTQIDKLKVQMYSYRSLDSEQAKIVWQNYRVEESHASTWLEGNTLTLSETRVALEQGITISEKPIKDYLEVVNFSQALDYMAELATNPDEVFNEQIIKDINRLVYKSTEKPGETAGQYRDVPVVVGFHTPPAPILVPDLMRSFVEWVNTDGQKLHSVELASEIHQRFVTIHPFVNGNGRTARLLMNFQLTKSGYLPISIKPDEASRKLYNDTLYMTQATENASHEPMNQLVANIVEDTLRERVELLSRYDANFEVNRKEREEREKRLSRFIGKKNSKKDMHR
ncbi:Fic family protein [Periweissella cryptocerci]|uniref:Fic family protein n=1 Tax=Periweissella cryptocerci TaxID=2506420 RepID=A0A4P6YX61_9LACO|nr:Fic family protein [Periweissella cryptocerci]QBO37397.1 Fic family protein [Periweissella cryptocerci]